MNPYRTILFTYILIFFLYLPCTSGNTPQQGVIFTNNIVQINGKDNIIQSCDFHYFRCPPELWEQRLTTIYHAGFNTVQTDVPWNYHEPVENQVDLRELDAFLDLCCRMGFYVIITPGLTIDSKCNMGGFPAWLNEKGLRFPSNDPDFMFYVRYWYENLVPIIYKHQINNGGSIIAVLIDDKYLSDFPFKEEMLQQILKILHTLGLNIPVVASWFPDTQESQESISDSIINALNYNLLYNTKSFKKNAHILRDLENNKNTIIYNYFSTIQENGLIGANYFINKLNVQWFSEFGLQSARAIPQPNAARILRMQKPVFQKTLTSWKFKKLSTMDWHYPWIKSSSAPTDWETITIGNNYEHSVTGFDGYVGYHTTIDIPTEIIHIPLYLNFFGAGDNVFVFINGILVYKHFREPNKFVIECKNIFHPGVNVVAIVTEIIPHKEITNIQPQGIFKSVILASEIKSPHPVEISEEIYNQTAFISLFNTSTAPQLFQFEYTDPITKKAIKVPKKDYYRLKSNDLQLLTCNVFLKNTVVRYSTSQILGTGKFDNQDILVLYGQENQPGEISLSYKDSLQVIGISNYEINKTEKSITLYYEHRETPYSFIVNNVLCLIVNTKNAGTTWMVSDDKNIYPLVFNSCLLRNFFYAPSEWKYEIFSKSGENINSFIVPSKPKSILLDGIETAFAYDSVNKLLSFSYNSPSPLVEAIIMRDTNEVRLTNEGVWHRFQFNLKKSYTEDILWKLNLQAKGDGLIYLNDWLLGRCSINGGQTEFYLPDCWINWGKDNTIAVILKNSSIEKGIASASISPYQESIRTRHIINIKW